MDPSLRSEEQIFRIARGISSADERSDYLKQVCGDNSQLFERMVVLLKTTDEENSFLENPPEALAVTRDNPGSVTEKPGTEIGPYKLLQQIGEGGFGVVYMAEQHRPVRRKVALKVIKPGMDTKEVIARFEAERQALAMMDHPNIAKVFDAGTTESSRPFFVMELVRGIPITEYCDNEMLGTRERLELFSKVCQAVQHAHQKGVIHRDIKPSNVLITEHDGTPVPKVIDFGVAKAINQQLTEKTVFTQFQQMIGTPLYMSPEQAALSGLDIDTRSDIYSLGVLLYELLTGTTPFDKQRFHKAAYEEIRRIIREEEPPRPSTKISSLGERTGKVLGARKTDVKKFQQLMRGEVDWIVMKAMEKDRKRRYETANGFAMDIQRYLEGDTVQACPPSVAYRFRKFANRNKAVLGTISIVAAALLLGIIGTSWQAFAASRAAEGEREAHAKAIDSEKVAQAVRADAEDRSKQLEKQLRVSKIMRLTAQSESARRSYPKQSVLLAIEAAKAAQFGENSLIPLAHETLLAATSSIGGIPLPFNKAAISPDSRWLVNAGRETELWDLTAEDPSRATILLRGHMDVVQAIEISANSHWLVTGSRDGTARIWDLSSSNPESSSIRLVGHKGGITALSISADSRWLVTGGEDQTACLWDLDHDDPAATAIELRGAHEIGIDRVEITTDGRRLVTHDRDQNLFIWDLSSQIPLNPSIPIKSSVRFRISSDARWLATWKDRENKLFDLTRNNPASNPINLLGHAGRVANVNFSPNSRWFASGNYDGNCYLWDLASDNPVESMINLQRHTGEVWAVSFSHDSKRLLTASHDSTGLIWDLTAEKISDSSFALHGHDGRIQHASLTPDGRWAVTGGHDRTIRLWNLNATNPGLSPIIFRGHEGIWARLLLISRDGRWLVSSERNRTGLRLWNLGDECRTSSPLILSPAVTKGGTIAGAPMSLNGRRLVTTVGNDVRVTDLSKPEPTLSSFLLRGHSDEVVCTAITPDGRWIVSGSRDNTCRVWDLRTSDPANSFAELRGHSAEVSSVAISANGRRVVTGSADATARLWELTGAEDEPKSRVLQGHQEGISHVAFSSDERWLVTRCATSARLWDLATDNVEVPSLVLRGESGNVAISPKSRWLAAMGGKGSNNTIRIWDLTHKNPTSSPLVLQIDSEIRFSRRFLFSPDDRFLYASAKPGVARFWDLTAKSPGDSSRLLDRGSSVVAQGLIFSSEGSKFITVEAGTRLTAQVWDLTSGGPAAKSVILRGHTAGINELAVDSRGHWAVTKSKDGEIRLWDLELSSALDRATRYVGRQLTEGERKNFLLDD